MRHRLSGRKLNRSSSHRKALFRNMACSLIEHGQIKTTLSKAKELRKFADRLVTLGKKDSVANRRRAFDFLRSRSLVTRLFSEISPKFEKRSGGYTRIYKLGYRKGDGAPVALIEYLREEFEDQQESSAKEKAKG